MEEKKEHRISIRFPHAVWEELTQLAHNEERSINWEVVQAIRERLAHKKKEKKNKS